MDRSTGAKKLSCRSTFTQPGRPKLSENAGIVTPGERGKELGVSELQNGRARARKSARGTRAERRADGTGTHLKVFGQSKLDPHKAASPMLPSCIAPFSGQVPVMSRATRSSVSTTRRAINVPQPDLPGAAGELERGGMGKTCAGRTSSLLTTRSLLFTRYLQADDREDQPEHAPFSIAVDAKNPTL